MISVENARARILASIHPLSFFSQPLSEAHGYFLADRIASPLDLPRFDNSAMDGYAVRSQDLKMAGAQSPVKLLRTSRIAAGESPSHPLESSNCARIFTGSPLPPGADAVVMQEDVKVEDEWISFFEPVKPLENVRLRGEDVRSGTVLLEAGQRLTAARLGLLAATGISEVQIHHPCKIALLATGSELREPGTTLAAGEIYESNRGMLAAFLKELGAFTHLCPLVRDDLARTTAELKAAFSLADVVITTGGVSVGELDFVKESLAQLGGTVDLWKIALRPGKPFVFGRLGEKFLFGLPGNPVSAFVTFLLFVRPAILKLQGASELCLPRLGGELAESINNPGDRRHFIRVRWQEGKIHLAGPQKSHLLAHLGQANALLDVPPDTHLKAGSIVEASVWELPES